MIGTLTLPVARAFGETDALQKIAAAGFDAIDYSMHLYSLSDGIFDLSREEIARRYSVYGAQAKAVGLTVGQLHAIYPTWTGCAKSDERRCTAVILGILAAGAMDCPYVIVHPMIPDAKTDGSSRAKIWRMNQEFYISLIPILRECRTKLCIENMFSFEGGRYVPNCVSTAEDMAEYIDRMNDIAGEERFAACLDTGHAHLLGLDLAGMVCALGSRLQTLHLHDNDGRGDAHTAPYMGTLNWDRFLRALRTVGYAGILSFEAHGFIDAYPPELCSEALSMLAATGHHFERKISE